MKIDDPKATPGPDLNWERFLGDAPKVDFSVSRFFQWRMYWDYAGGPATDLLVHTFTPIFCILELDFPQRVFGGGGTFQYDREVPDQCNIIADYPDGPSVVMTNSLSNHVPADTVIRGTDGIITWAMLQGGTGEGVRIVPFAKDKKEILMPWKGQGRYEQALGRPARLRQNPQATQVQHRHGRPRPGTALHGHPVAPRKQSGPVRSRPASPFECRRNDSETAAGQVFESVTHPHGMPSCPAARHQVTRRRTGPRKRTPLEDSWSRAVRSGTYGKEGSLMKIGVFLLIEPFASVEVQLQRAKAMGFECADITDTNAGGSMLGSAGFSPTDQSGRKPL